MATVGDSSITNGVEFLRLPGGPGSGRSITARCRGASLRPIRHV